MLEQRSVAFGDGEITIESLPATKSLELFAELMHIAGGLGQGIKDVPSTAEDLKKFGEMLDMGAMVQGLFERVDPEKTPALVKRIVKDSMPKWRDKPSTEFEDWYEDRFSRGHADLVKLLYAIFEWNYGDPIAWIKKALAKFETEEVQASETGEEEPSK